MDKAKRAILGIVSILVIMGCSSTRTTTQKASTGSNTITQTNKNSSSLQNQGKVVFEGSNNHIVVENDNVQDRSKNNKSVLIVKGDGNKVKIKNKNITDHSENRTDTLIIDGSNNQIGIGTANVEDRTKNVVSTTEIVDDNASIQIQHQYQAKKVVDQTDIQTKHVITTNEPTGIQKKIEYYEEQAAFKNPEAAFELGLIYWQDEQVKDCAKALAWFTKSAEAGLPEAQLVLGQFYLDEFKDCPQYTNKQKAIHWLKEAAENKATGARDILNGLGVE